MSFNKEKMDMTNKDDQSKKKRARRKKDRKDRLKERLRPKSAMTSFSSDFLNNTCKANGIPVLQERWMFKKED